MDAQEAMPLTGISSNSCRAGETTLCLPKGSTRVLRKHLYVGGESDLDAKGVGIPYEA